MSFPKVSLLLNIDLLSQDGVQFQDCALKSNDSLLALAKAHLEPVDLVLVLATLMFHVCLMLASHLLHLGRDTVLQAGHLIGMSLVLGVHFGGMSVVLSFKVLDVTLLLS